MLRIVPNLTKNVIIPVSNKPSKAPHIMKKHHPNDKYKNFLFNSPEA